MHLKPTLALMTRVILRATGTIVHNAHRRECVKFNVHILSDSLYVANSLRISAEITLVKISLSFSPCGCNNDSRISHLHSTIALCRYSDSQCLNESAYPHNGHKLSSGRPCSSRISNPFKVCLPYHPLSYRIRNFFVAYERELYSMPNTLAAKGSIISCQ